MSFKLANQINIHCLLEKRIFNYFCTHETPSLSLMQYTIIMLLEEMASIFLTPYLLMFVVPKVVSVPYIILLLHHKC